MKPFDYASPASLAEAIELLGPGEARPLAGGTDLITLMKGDLASPDRLIDIKRLADLPADILADDAGLVLGALTTLTEIERNPLVRERAPALAAAAAQAATPQLRNMATLGGNLLQRPRCWYFRHSHIDCWLKNGADCPARAGENQHHAIFDVSPCVAVHPSDLAPALLALAATVELHGPAGQRTLPIADLFAPPDDARRVETTLDPAELVVRLRLPAPVGWRSTYLKAMDRKVWSFALVSVAAALHLEDGRITAARLALGGVAPVPWRLSQAEQLLHDAAPSPTLFDQVAAAAVAAAVPLAHNRYKLPLAQVLIRRALAELTA